MASEEADHAPDGGRLQRPAFDQFAGTTDADRSGNGEAVAALETPMRGLGTALAGAVALLNPQAILISGGLADALDVMKPPLLAALQRQLPPHLREIDIRPGAFGSRAGLVGAALAGAAGAGWRHIR